MGGRLAVMSIVTFHSLFLSVHGEHGAAQLQAAPCRERAAGRLQRPATAREGRADRPGQAREAEWGICAPLAVHWVVPSTTLQQLVRS